MTGLNKSTVLSLVEELSVLGLVAESSAVSDGSRGRPSSIVHPNTTDVVAVVTEIAVDFARLAVIGLGGTVLQSIDIDVSPRRLGPAATAQALGEAGVQLIVPGSAVVAAATAIHGVVSPEGHLVTAPNIDWHDIDLPTFTRSLLPGGIDVFFGNDADLGALGEHRRGAGAAWSDLLYISAERGIGGGLIRDGRLQSGARGYGTELGHLIVSPGGRTCACGAAGCLETEIGEAALLRKAGRRTDARTVIELARNGDTAAMDAVTDVASWLGFAIGNLVTLLDPERVIAGGYLADIVELAGDVVRAEVDQMQQMRRGDLVPIVPSTLGRDAALIGAAELAFDHVLQDPAAISPRQPMKETG